MDRKSRHHANECYFTADWHLRFKASDSVRAFTLVELVVVIAAIVILLALLLPAISMARASSRQRQCASNLRQMAAAWTGARTRQPVVGTQWTGRLGSYLQGGTGVLFCPDDTARALASSYALHDFAWRYLAQDTGRVVFLDYKQLEINVVGKTVGQLDVDWLAQQAPRHFKKVNVAMVDGHVDAYDPRKIDPKYCDYFVRYWRPVADSNINLAGCANSADTPPGLPGGTSSTMTTSSTGSGTTTGPAPPCPGLPSTVTLTIVAANNGSVNEGAVGQITPVTLTVTLSQAASQTVTVQVVTVDESATVGNNDYQALNQTVTFTAGQTTKRPSMSWVTTSASRTRPSARSCATRRSPARPVSSFPPAAPRRSQSTTTTPTRRRPIRAIRPACRSRWTPGSTGWSATSSTTEAGRSRLPRIQTAMASAPTTEGAIGQADLCRTGTQPRVWHWWP